MISQVVTGRQKDVRECSTHPLTKPQNQSNIFSNTARKHSSVEKKKKNLPQTCTHPSTLSLWPWFCDIVGQCVVAPRSPGLQVCAILARWMQKCAVRSGSRADNNRCTPITLAHLPGKSSVFRESTRLAKYGSLSECYRALISATTSYNNIALKSILNTSVRTSRGGRRTCCRI